MHNQALAKHRWSLGVFLLALLLFQLAINGLIISQQENFLVNEAEQHTQQQFRLLGELTSAALTNGRYADVEAAMQTWGELDQSILQARLTTANDFQLAEYVSDLSDTKDRTTFYKGTILYGENKLARIEVTKSMATTDTVIRRLVTALLGFSILLLIVLGLFLYRFALRPLQREIEQHLITEEQLRDHARNLETANNELEAFSYSLSHDLRTPLRAITSYSQIILEDEGDRLSSEKRQFFDRIIVASKHMAQLIDDIIALARVSRVKMETHSVNLSDLARRYLQTRLQDNPQAVQWEVQPNLVTTGNPQLLAQLLENLLDNAIKYSATQPSPQISFGTAQSNGRTAYAVRDNGVGFDMRYASKVFVPFQRLHDQSEFGGTGIGMATAYRIVERHEGQLWVDSTPGKGTVFYFTLPEQIKN